MRIPISTSARLRQQVRRALLGTTLAVAAPGAMAAMITVDSTADMSSDSQCTLRDAITSANMNEDTGGCMAGDETSDTIVFSDGVAGGTIMLGGTALPTVAADSVLTIGTSASADDDDADSNGVTIDANQMSRIFVNRGNLTLNELTLVNGLADTADGDDANGSAADDRSGGAILNDEGGILTVNGGAMNNNTSDRAGGAIEEASGTGAGTVAVALNDVDFSGNDAGMTPGNGGVLHVTGTADIAVNGGTFDSNTAREGGALWNNGGTMTIDGAMFTANTATGPSGEQGGGAIYGEGLSDPDDSDSAVGGTITVTGATFADNTVGSDDVDQMDGSDSQASGGAILASDGSALNVADSVFRDNGARRAGGAIEVRAGSATTLDNVSATGNDAGMNPGNGGVLHMTGAADVDVLGGVYRNNTAVEGGAFWNNGGTLDLTGVALIANDASGDEADQGGGAVYSEADAGGTVTIDGGRIALNTASGMSGSGGGILMNTGSTLNMTGGQIAGNTANRAGGGIENAGAAVTLTSVALGGVNANFANDAGSNPGNGGGLHIGGEGTALLTRSSVGYNTAVNGGGLWNSGAGTLTVDTSTVANNTADRGAGVYLDGAGGTIALDYASVTNNNGTGVFAVEGAGGSITIGNSLIAGNDMDIGDGVTASEDEGNTTGMVALNGAYRLYGGPTATQPLAMNSVALDTNANCGDGDDSTDQRGAERPFDAVDDTDGDCDSGAYELTDDPVITVTSNGAASRTVNAEETNVVVAAFTLANSDADQVTVDGFSGRVEVNVALPPGVSLEDVTLNVLQDVNGDGQMDSNAMNAVGTTTVSNGMFSVDFNDGVSTIPGNDSLSFLLVVESIQADDQGDDVTSVQQPRVMPGSSQAMWAGGALLGLLGLFSVGGVRRRTQLMLIAAVLATVVLTGCSDSDDDDNVDLPNNMDNANVGNDTAPVQGNVQFVIDQLDSEDMSLNILIGDGLPVRGVQLTIAADASTSTDD